MRSTLVYFLFLIFATTSKAEGGNQQTVPTNDLDGKTTAMELDKGFAGDGTVPVVKKPFTEGVLDGFTKFVLYGTEANAFHVSEFKFKGETVQVNGTNLKENYVHDVYTYWKGDNFVLLVLRYWKGGNESYYKYFEHEQGVWTEVDVSEYNPPNTKLLQPTDLNNLLKKLGDKFADSPKGTPKPDDKDSNKGTVVVVSVVVALVVVLLLVGLVFFLRR